MRGSLGLFGALWLAFATAAGAQEETLPQVFEDAIDVRAVNVETVVTDADDRPVRGLRAEDFRLLVDGREVPITFFDEVAEGSSVTAGGEAVGRNYLVFIDDGFSLAAARDAVLERMERDLGLLGPADRMAVLASDGRRIDVLARWTDDRGRLAAALAAARRRPAQGNRMILSEQALRSDATAVVEGGLEPDLQAFILDWMSNRTPLEARTQAGYSAPAAAAALRAFETPPGRKLMLLLSGARSLALARELYFPLIEAANRLGYTVYPVEVATSAAKAVDGFDKLARLTGGRAVVTSRSGIFREVVEDSGSYYWLGFTPEWKGDDYGHRLTVEVRRPGLKARARAGYSDLSRRTQSLVRTESVLLFGGEEEDRKLIIQLGKPERAGRKEVQVAVTLGVPVDALTFTLKDGGYLAEVPLVVSTLDDKGGRADLPGSTLRVLLQQPPKGTGYARFRTVVRLRNAEQRLVFTLYDQVQGALLWGEAEFVPAPRG